MDDIPVIQVAFIVVLCVTVPVLVLLLIFGGRGLLWGVGLAFAGIAAYLFWGFVLGGISFSTGMEGLALVIWPFIWVAGSIWAALLYLVVKACGWLPDQRRHRDA